MDDPVKLKKDTIKIEGDRNLYNYTFEIDDETPSEKPDGKLNKDQPEASE
jgi:hypothetical protein